MTSNKNIKKTATYAFVLVVSFIVPILIMIFAYYTKGIYPGGENTILAMDMKAQYMPFYASLRYLWNSDNSLFFNMSGSLGNNFWGSFAYYLTSPLVWITIFFPLEILPDLIYFITLIKIGGCGVCFCAYLLYSYDDIRNKHFAFLIACCYALMSYNIAYSINLMWLDGVMLLPIILIGIERILNGKSVVWLIVATALSVFLCYYISFMTAVFAVFYVLIRCFETNNFNIKTITKLAIGASVGAGITMPVVFPGIVAMSQGKLAEVHTDSNPIIQYRVIDLFKQLLSGRYDTVYNDGLPFVYCGTVTVLMAVLFFVLNTTEWKNKILYCLVVAFYIFSMCITPIDKMMHGFRETACFEVRYSYVFCCLLLTLAYRGMGELSNIAVQHKTPLWMWYILGGYILIELFMNSSIITSCLMVDLHYSPRSEYERILLTKRSLLDCIDDEGFYRVSDNSGYTHNEGAWLGYNGFGYFSSCYDYKLMKFLGDLGENQSYHDLEDGDRTKLIDSIFGAKYILNYMTYDDSYDLLATCGMHNLEYNKDALPIGFMVDYSPKDGVKDLSSNAFENQNNLARELSGLKETEVFKEIPVENYSEYKENGYAKSVHLDVTAKKNQTLWLYVEWAKADERNKHKPIVDETDPNTSYRFSSRLSINGIDYGGFMDDNSSFMVFLGNYDTDEVLHIDACSTLYFGEIHVAYMDDEAYYSVINKLGENVFVVSEHRNGKFRGTITALNDGNILFTLPSIDGWRILIDGKRVQYDNYRDVLLLVPISTGQHEIDISYVPPGLGFGCALGIVFMIIFVYAKKKEI